MLLVSILIGFLIILIPYVLFSYFFLGGVVGGGDVEMLDPGVADSSMVAGNDGVF